MIKWLKRLCSGIRASVLSHIPTQTSKCTADKPLSEVPAVYTTKIKKPKYDILITKTSKKGREFIKRFEGLKLEAYKCPAGVWTIGYGHTRRVKQGDVITKEIADYFLDIDLIEFEKAVVENCTLVLTQNEFDALVSFTYNVGEGALKRSTLLRLLNQGDIDLAAEEFLKWNKAGEKVLRGLTKRRKAERRLFLTGQYN